MHYAWWILIAIYSAFAIRFGVRSVRNMVNDRNSDFCRNAGRLYWLIVSLAFLIFAALFSVWLLLWPRRWWYARKERRRREQEEKETRAREERIRKWEEEHPPVVCYNTVNGVTAVVPERDYKAMARYRKREIRNGQATERLLPPIFHTYLFLHASAKNVPADFQTAWLSDFDDLRKVARVERRRDIFVPFVSEAVMPFSEQEKVIRKPDKNLIDINARLKEARRILLYVAVPDDVRFAPVAPPRSSNFLSGFLRFLRSRGE